MWTTLFCFLFAILKQPPKPIYPFLVAIVKKPDVSNIWYIAVFKLFNNVCVCCVHSVVEQDTKELCSETDIKSLNSSPSLECDINCSMKELVNREVLTPLCQSVSDANQDVTNFEKTEESKAEVKEIIDHNGDFECEWFPTSVKQENESTFPDHFENKQESVKPHSLSSIKIENVISLYEHEEDIKVSYIYMCVCIIILFHRYVFLSRTSPTICDI